MAPPLTFSPPVWFEKIEGREITGRKRPSRVYCRPMKKILVRLILGLVILIILAVLGVGFFLDSIVKKSVETIGPQLTKVDIKLDSVSLHLLTGSGGIKGLVVGNPEGYKTPQAISV